MTTPLTAPAAHPLGSWLATLAVSLLLLALAYAHASDPAEYLGLRSPGPRPLAHRLAPKPRDSRFAAGQAPALAATQLKQPTGPNR